MRDKVAPTLGYVSSIISWESANQWMAIISFLLSTIYIIGCLHVKILEKRKLLVELEKQELEKDDGR